MVGLRRPAGPVQFLWNVANGGDSSIGCALLGRIGDQALRASRTMTLSHACFPRLTTSRTIILFEHGYGGYPIATLMMQFLQGVSLPRGVLLRRARDVRSIWYVMQSAANIHYHISTRASSVSPI